MNTEDFFDRRAGDKMLRAYNVGCMMPYMDYEPKTLSEIARGTESMNATLGGSILKTRIQNR